MKKVYDYDKSTIKKLGENRVKLTYVRTSLKPGFEYDSTKNHTAKNTANEQKLDNNIARAKTRVQELVLCNPWDYWCTFTISPEKYDRHDLKLYHKHLAEFLHNYNRRCSESEKVKYLLIPEMHKDGAWHMHGFIKGIRKEDLYVNSYGYLTWKQYEQKFGFISMSAIKDIDKASSYMMKYMTKDITNTVSELGAHTYYCSNGLQKAEVIYKGSVALLCDWDYEHPDGYCKIKMFDTRRDNIADMIEVME